MEENDNFWTFLVGRFACKTSVIVDASSNPSVSHVKSL